MFALRSFDLNSSQQSTQCNFVGDSSKTGNRSVFAPDFTGSVTTNYKKKLEAGTLDLSVSLHYQTKMYFDANNRVSQAGYPLLNARASWVYCLTQW